MPFGANDTVIFGHDDEVVDDSPSTFENRSRLKEIWEGAKGTAAFAGDFAAGFAKIPTRAALAVGGKLVDPSRSLQNTWDVAGEAVDETYPSFTKALGANPENLGYAAPMKPFELYGQGLEYAAEKLSRGNPDVQGAINVGGSVLPIPFAGKAAKLAGKVLTRLDPTLYNIEADAANAAMKRNKPRVEDVMGKNKPIFGAKDEAFVPERMNETAQYELFDQPEMGRVANPYEAKLGDWRVDENGIPIKVDLTMDAQNAAQPLQRNLWGDELQQTRNPVGQNADLFAPEGMQEGVPLPQAIDEMPWAQRRGAINSRLKGELDAGGTLNGAVAEANSPFTGMGKNQSGAIHPDLLGLGVTDKIIDLFKKYRDAQNRPSVADDPYLASTGNKAAATRAFNNLQKELQTLENPRLAVQQMFRVADYEGVGALGFTGPEGVSKELYQAHLASKAAEQALKEPWTNDKVMSTGALKRQATLANKNLVALSEKEAGSTDKSLFLMRKMNDFDRGSENSPFQGMGGKQAGGTDFEFITRLFTTPERARALTVENVDNFKEPINPRVKPLVSALNDNGIITRLSGDLYGKPLVYVDLDVPYGTLKDLKLPPGWKIGPNLYLHTEGTLGLASKLFANPAFAISEGKKQVPGFEATTRIFKGTEGTISAKESALIADAIKKLGAEKKNNVVELPPPKIPVGEATEIFNSKDVPAPNLSIVPKGQRGGVGFEDIASLFRKAEANPRQATPHTPVKDTVLNPIGADNIAQKTDLRKKAQAVGVDAYSRVTTIEEALAGVSKDTDMSAVGNNSLRSGSEGALRTNQKNTVVNFLRTKRQEAVNMFEEKSKQYVTGKDEGVVQAFNSLLKNKEEANAVAEALIMGDRNGVVLSTDQMNTLGWSVSQMEAYTKVRAALDARYAFATEQAGLQGFEPFKPRDGYVPSNFSGSYTKFIGFTDKKGNWHTRGIAQGNTTFEVNQAINKYKEMGKEYSEVIDGGFRGIKDTKGVVRNYNGFAEIVARLAEFDPAFAKAKAIADQHMSEQARSLYRFDVHEIKKSGVKGSLGDRPWLSRDRNTKELFASITDYLETGFRYDAYQGFLMDGEKVINDPKVLAEMPNTASFGRKYLDNVRGNTLNAVGSFVNSVVNIVAETTSKVGVSSRFLPKTISAIQAGSTSLMMGFFNFGFGLMQLTQPITGGLPEAMRIKASLGLSHTDVATSMAAGPMNASLIMLGQEKHVPTHFKDAWDWAHKHGLTDFSEAELAHNLGKSAFSTAVGNIVNAPIIYPEKATRLPIFMSYTDLFHKAGFRGEEAHLRAQAATDYAMGNYNPDERPMIYSQMGELGKMVGALSTYKHNLVEQNVSSVINAGKNPEALAVMAATAFSLYGVSGLPGYQDTDKVVKAITDKNIRELVLDVPRGSNLYMDGLVSWYSDIDIQSRLSMSQVLPDPSKPLAIAPHINNFWNITSSAIEYAKNQNEASLRQLIYKGSPAQVRNMYEANVLTNAKGVVRNPKGEVNAEQPRTPTETTTRSVLGLRPLRERIDSETTWTAMQREISRGKDMKEATKQFEAAARLSDMKGMAQWASKYQEAGGDISQLYSKIGDIIVEGSKTPKQRAEGTVKDNLNSIRRYENYND